MKKCFMKITIIGLTILMMGDALQAMNVEPAKKGLFQRLIEIWIPDKDELNKALLDAAKTGNEQEADRLIRDGADVNVRGENKNTPLIIAAAYGHELICKLLIKNNADINARNILGPIGQTPFMLAGMNGYKSICELLINHRKDSVSAQNIDDQMALMMACYHGIKSGDASLYQLLINEMVKLTKKQNNAVIALEYRLADPNVIGSKYLQPDTRRLIVDEFRRSLKNQNISDVRNMIETRKNNDAVKTELLKYLKSI